MARSCLRVFLLYIIGAVAIGVLVYHRFPVWSAAVWSGAIAGFFLWLGLAYVIAIPRTMIDWWRMRPGAKPRDGKRSAIIGPIRHTGSSLHAPFSRKPCVAYHYKVVSMAGENPSTDYEGFALVPSYITTEEGQVRILAYPELDIPWERLKGEEPKGNARAFIDATSFTNTREKGFKGALAEMKELLADDDGSIRYDHRVEPVTDDLGKCMLEERVLLSGDTICAIGRYSEERRAFVPDPDGLVHAVTIKKGSAGSFRGREIRKVFGNAIGVVICFGLLIAAAGFFLTNVPMDAAEQMNPTRKFFWEEVKLERWIEREIRMPMNTSGVMHFLELCDHCATGRLEAGGKVIELKHASGWEDVGQRVVHLAAAEGERDGVTLTYDKKQRGGKVAIIINGTEFPVPDDWLIPSDIQTSLHTNETLDGRVRVMAPNDSIRLRASFRAPLEQR